MPHESRSSSRKRTPPETTNAIALDALPEEGCSTRALHLEGRFEGINGGEYHAEGSSALEMG